MLSLDGEMRIGTTHLRDALAGGQVKFAHFRAGEVLRVAVVHLGRAPVKHVDQILDQDAVDLAKGGGVVGADEDLGEKEEEDNKIKQSINLRRKQRRFQDFFIFSYIKQNR